MPETFSSDQVSISKISICLQAFVCWARTGSIYSPLRVICLITKLQVIQFPNYSVGLAGFSCFRVRNIVLQNRIFFSPHESYFRCVMRWKPGNRVWTAQFWTPWCRECIHLNMHFLKFRQPKYNSKHGCKCTRYNGPSLWNRVDNKLKLITAIFNKWSLECTCSFCDMCSLKTL